RDSQPVFLGTASLMAQLGQTGGDAFTKLSGNAQNFGAVMSSVGSIVHSAGDTVINVASDLGTVWGQNANTMNTAIGGIGRAVSGLASGAVPVLSAGLAIVTTDLTAVTNVAAP